MTSPSGSSSAGTPVPLNLKIPREGGIGGVEGSGSSWLMSPSRSLSLSEQSDGVGASIADGGRQLREVAAALDDGGCEVDKEVELERRKELKVEADSKLESDEDGRERRLAVGPEKEKIYFDPIKRVQKRKNIRESS